MKIEGILNSQGEFNGNRYHNLVFQVTFDNPNDKKDVCGKLVDTVKIRYVDLNTILGLGLADPADAESLTAESFSDYVGAEIEVGYNKYGAVQSLKVLKAPESKTAAENKKS